MATWLITIEVETKDSVKLEDVRAAADKLADDAAVRFSNEIEGDSTVVSFDVEKA